MEYRNIWCNHYFWRTKEQKEVDFIEEKDGKIEAYEFKYSSRKSVKLPNAFAAAYPEASFNVMSPENIETFLL